ncbi:MAG: glycosyltransferase family 39 protein, partial [Anaerolineae bacterium]
MWVDEGASISVANYPIPKILESRIYIQDSSYRDFHPPLYYLILSGSRRLLGESDFSYRYVSVIFSLLTLSLIFKLGEKLHSTQAGLIALGLDSIIPISIQYAQEARMYTLVVLLAVLVTYKLLELLHKTEANKAFSITALIPIVIASALLAFANYSAWFFLGCQGIFVFWWGWKQGFKTHIVIFSSVSFILFALFWLFFKPDLPYFDSGQFDPWLLASFAQRLLDNTFTLSTAPSLMGQLAGLKSILGWLIYLIVAIGIFQIPKKVNRLVLLTHWLAIPIGLFLMEIITPGFQNIFHLRHVL